MNYVLTPNNDTLPAMPQNVIDFLQTNFYDKEIYFNEVQVHDREDVDKPDIMEVQAAPFEILIQNAVCVNQDQNEAVFNSLKKFRRDHLPPKPTPEPEPANAKKK